MSDTGTKKKIVIIALVAVAVLFCLRIFLETTGEYKYVCDTINALGYHFIADDLIIAYDEQNTTIRNAAGAAEDFDIAVAESKYLGFSSDIDRVGDVTLILATEDGEVVTLYMLDGEPELCFIQDKSGSIIKRSNKS